MIAASRVIVVRSMERRSTMLHDETMNETMERVTSFLPQIKIFESLPAEIIREIEQLVTRSSVLQ